MVEGQTGIERDGLWCLGTGSPRLDGDRTGASLLFLEHAAATLVDCGIGALYRLTQLGVRPHQVGALFVTHHHVDHIADLPALILARWIARRQHPGPQLRILGPCGTREFVESSLRTYAVDIESRVATGWSAAELFPEVVELDDGDVVSVGVWEVTAFRVDHNPITHALGYAVARGTRRVVISGDTRPSPTLIAHAQGTDVLLHEAIYPGYGIPASHTLAQDVGRVAAQAQAKRLVLTHLIPGTLQDAAWIEAVREHFDGPVIVARDLLQVADWAGPTDNPFDTLASWAPSRLRSEAPWVIGGQGDGERGEAWKEDETP